MKRVLGCVTIGQSPRDDIVPELHSWMEDHHVEIFEVGALDGLSQKEIQDWKPRDGHNVLVTRLASGESVLLEEEKLLHRVQRVFEQIQSHVSAILLLCTGTFPKLNAEVPVFYPDKILSHFISGVLWGPDVHLGILTPSIQQSEQQLKRWRAVAPNVEIRVASPYGDLTDLTQEAKSFAHGVEMVLLDCMGYSKQMKSLVQEQVSYPVLLAREVVGRTLAAVI